MHKLIASALITLDGLVGGANNELDWFMPDDEFEAELRRLHSTVDTILLGRVTYEVFVPFWPTADDGTAWGAKHMNQTTKIVVSTTLKDAPWGAWPPARIISDHLAEEIK